MLIRLRIRHLALIEQAELDLGTGLTVFTGETGAGKSMLMDALALATGARADKALIRQGATQALVEATFQLSTTVAARLQPRLGEAGVGLDDPREITLRRTLEAERSGAFIDGQKVSLSLLQQVGEELVDIHGQHEHQLLFRPSAHAQLLDNFGQHSDLTLQVAGAYQTWQTSLRALADLQQRAADRDHQLELLRSYVDELVALDPQPQEADQLQQERRDLLAAERDGQALQQGLAALQETGLSGLGQAARALSDVQNTQLAETIARVQELYTQAQDIAYDLTHQADRLLPNPERLAVVDQRLFSLKDCARKHRCGVDDLPAQLATLQQSLQQLDQVGENLTALERQATAQAQAYQAAATALTAARQAAAERLVGHIHSVLAPLKMERCQFQVQFTARPADQGSATGQEAVQFMVATNAGANLQPLEKVASGGEASRLLLALKTVMYQQMSPRTLVFDEIDTGVGGAVADAVGDNLRALAQQHQVLVITHQPQVAAKGANHLKIEKHQDDVRTVTAVTALVREAERVDELARMLAGKEVTAAAKAAAKSLLRPGTA